MATVWVVVLTGGLKDRDYIWNNVYVGRTQDEAVAKFAASCLQEIETYRDDDGDPRYQNIVTTGIGNRDLGDEEIIEMWMDSRDGDEDWEVFEADL